MVITSMEVSLFNDYVRKCHAVMLTVLPSFKTMHCVYNHHFNENLFVKPSFNNMNGTLREKSIHLKCKIYCIIVPHN